MSEVIIKLIFQIETLSASAGLVLAKRNIKDYEREEGAAKVLNPQSFFWCIIEAE
jgi:hypothetical protein